MWLYHVPAYMRIQATYPVNTVNLVYLYSLLHAEQRSNLSLFFGAPCIYNYYVRVVSILAAMHDNYY